MSRDQSIRQCGPDWAALVIATGLLAMAALIAFEMQSVRGSASYSSIGPAMFPLTLAGGIALVALGLIAESLRGVPQARPYLEWSPIIWIVAGMIVQILLLRSAGFSIATGAVFAFVARGFGQGPLWKTIPLGIVLAFIVFLIFDKGLHLSLPQGFLERLM